MSLGARALLSSASLLVHRAGRLVDWQSGVRILYYHSVSDAPIRSSVSPPEFERQMAHLTRGGYRPLTFSEAVRRLAERAPLPARAVVITLDDGFQDNYEHAFPILTRLGLPATIFLTAAYIGTDRLPTLTRSDFMPRPLSWEQVREMHAHGLEFGSHSLTHPMLAQIPLEQARREARESKRLIEEKLGAPVPFFCYPRGNYNAAVKRMVRDEGYEAACTTWPGANRPRTDLFALRRTYVSRRDTPGEFAKKVMGAHDLLQRGLYLWHRARRR